MRFYLKKALVGNLKKLGSGMAVTALSMSLCAGALSGCAKSAGNDNNTSSSDNLQVGESSVDGQETQETETKFPVIERKTADEIKINPEKIDVTTFALPDGPEESGVFVQPIADISDDFIRGMDASAVLAVENSGAKYYGFDGEEQDVFKTLAESGVNYIRLRVWNDPYDENGNGYRSKKSLRCRGRRMGGAGAAGKRIF